MSSPDSPFSKLQGSFGKSTPPVTSTNYTHPQEDALRQTLHDSLNQTPTGAALLQFAAQQKIATRIIKGKNASGFIPESRSVYIGIAPELSTLTPEAVLELGAYLRQAQLQILGHKNPEKSMTSLDQAIAFDSKILDSVVVMCKIATEHYEKSHTEFVDALLRMGHGELYESYKKNGNGPELIQDFYKLYIES